MSLIATLRPGKKVRIFFNDGNINNALLHIRAVVDEQVVVSRTWGKYSRTWTYRMDDMLYLELLHREGILTVLRGKEKA